MDEPLWVNLKVISKLEPFQRINTRPRLFQIHAGNNSILLESLQRWWARSNRSSDFDRIKDLYVNAEQALETTTNKTELMDHLKDSLKGLEALQKTYEDDVTLKARIDYLIDFVRRLIGQTSK